jgi:hypothetical protein
MYICFCEDVADIFGKTCSFFLLTQRVCTCLLALHIQKYPMKILRAVLIENCDENRKHGCSLRLAVPLTDVVSDENVIMDGIWRLRVVGTPDRFMRLRGEDALQNLLSKYTFIDKHGCAYNGDTTTQGTRNLYENAEKMNSSIRAHPSSVRRLLRTQGVRRIYGTCLPRKKLTLSCMADVKCMGLPQREKTSGVCWYGSMLFISMFNAPIRRIILDCVMMSRLSCARTVYRLLRASLKSPRAAEELRRLLFHEFRIGDDISIPPHEEGQNGMTQFAMFCKVFNVPVQILYAHKGTLIPHNGNLVSRYRQMPSPRPPRKGEPSLLFVRVVQSVWKPPDVLTYSKNMFKVQGAFIGSEFCGHQTALARGSMNYWHHYDSDSVRMGIGPCAWLSPSMRFWQDLGAVFGYSNNTDDSKFCDFSPHQRNALDLVKSHFRAHGVDIDAMESKQGAINSQGAPNLINVDWVYTNAGTSNGV